MIVTCPKYQTNNVAFSSVFLNSYILSQASREHLCALADFQAKDVTAFDEEETKGSTFSVWIVLKGKRILSGKKVKILKVKHPNSFASRGVFANNRHADYPTESSIILQKNEKEREN